MLLCTIIYFIINNYILIFRYKAAQEIDNQVKQMSSDIKEIVNNLNKANSKKDSDDDVNNNNLIINYTCFVNVVLCFIIN